MSLFLFTAASQQPIMVKIIEPREKGLGDVLMESLGLSVVITLAAVTLGVVMAGVLFWIRSRSV